MDHAWLAQLSLRRKSGLEHGHGQRQQAANLSKRQVEPESTIVGKMVDWRLKQKGCMPSTAAGGTSSRGLTSNRATTLQKEVDSGGGALSRRSFFSRGPRGAAPAADDRADAEGGSKVQRSDSFMTRARRSLARVGGTSSRNVGASPAAGDDVSQRTFHV